jgi:hypothetical protein
VRKKADPKVCLLTFSNALTLVAWTAIAPTAAASATTTASATATTTTAASATEATTTATASTAAAKSAATATRSTLGFGSCFVHGQRASIHLLAIKACDCCICFGVVAHFDKGETARLSAITVANDIDGVHLPKLCKRTPQRIFIGLEI